MSKPMSKPMSKKEELQTIDPAALAKVSGGVTASSSAGSSNDAVMTALTGVLDSLKSLSTQQSQGSMNPMEMMMMMMMMSGRSSGAQVVAQQQPSNWTYDANNGYWIVK